MLDISATAAPAVTDDSFVAPRLLRHAHVQNIIASTALRRLLLARRARAMGLRSEQLLLDCGDGVRLTGELDLLPQARSLVFLLHGWEGSSQSAYVLSAALRLLAAGHSVFRLNFRDHGDSHHLNPGLFNSVRLDEVLHALLAVRDRFPHEQYFLAGWSLGGNFALRLALTAPGRGLALRQVAAICPVIDPAQTLEALEDGSALYHHYFVRKWRRSLLRKLDHFPHYGYGREIRRLRSLSAMHDFFVPRFTDFAHRNDYFQAYAVTPEQLASLSVPTTLISSLDDPITRAELLPPLAAASPALSMQLSQHGAHCAFLKDLALNSWIDEQLPRLFR